MQLSANEKQHRCIKILSASFFPLLLLKVYGWVEYGGSKTAELHTQWSRYKFSVNRFPLSKSSRWHNILKGHANPRDHTSSSSLPLTHYKWTHLLLACHPWNFSWSYLQPAANTMHVITLLSAENTKVLSTLGTRYISGRFCSQIRQMSKGFSSQYPRQIICNR